ncbi:MAG: hypothetical protein AB7W47_18060 [Calditrichaceae bacterium]
MQQPGQRGTTDSWAAIITMSFRRNLLVCPHDQLAKQAVNRVNPKY